MDAQAWFPSQGPSTHSVFTKLTRASYIAWKCSALISPDLHSVHRPKCDELQCLQTLPEVELTYVSAQSPQLAGRTSADHCSSSPCHHLPSGPPQRPHLADTAPSSPEHKFRVMSREQWSTHLPCLVRQLLDLLQVLYRLLLERRVDAGVDGSSDVDSFGDAGEV